MTQVKTCLLILFTVAFAAESFSQAKQKKYREEEIFEGGYSSDSPAPIPPTVEPKPNLLVLLKYDNRDILAGNACVREETVKLGFEYMVLCNRKVSLGNKIWVYFYNFGSNVELTFKNGFGWKHRLKKRIVECRRSSGDFIW